MEVVDGDEVVEEGAGLAMRQAVSDEKIAPKLKANGDQNSRKLNISSDPRFLRENAHPGRPFFLPPLPRDRPVVLRESAHMAQGGKRN